MAEEEKIKIALARTKQRAEEFAAKQTDDRIYVAVVQIIGLIEVFVEEIEKLTD